MVVVVMLINNAYKQTEYQWLIERRETEGSPEGLIGRRDAYKHQMWLGRKMTNCIQRR